MGNGMQTGQRKVTILLLPGLHGTEALFANFISRCPDSFEAIAFSYPPNQIMSYKELTKWLCERIENISGPLVLVGESFSGPLSLFVANQSSNEILAVILVASFIYPPRPSFFKWLPWEFGFSITKPLYALRSRLSRNLLTSSVIHDISMELQKVNPSVLAHRVREILAVDAGAALRSCHIPILYLQAGRDRIVPKSALQRIWGISTAVEAVSFPTPHFLLQSAPQQAWSAIHRFIRNLPSKK